MENGQGSNFEKNGAELQDISKNLRKKMKDSVNSSEMKKMFSDLKEDSNLDNNINEINDLLYHSVERIFDIGFNLAKKLDFELIADFFEKEKKDE